MRLLIILLAIKSMLKNLSSNPNMGETHHKFMAWLVETMLDLQGQKGRLLNLYQKSSKELDEVKKDAERIRKNYSALQKRNAEALEEIDELMADNQILRETIRRIAEEDSYVEVQTGLEQVKELR